MLVFAAYANTLKSLPPKLAGWCAAGAPPERLHFSTALSPNHALVAVAQEVAERLQQAYPPPSDDDRSVEAM
ncbi:MAG: hypothetical protein HC780_28825 [Leptolyngbyaceae cyanobacterium CSU_1_3]|nr:hypothetical protein [Leptolyngbyaceae cyanobacterium CSU_1_3]